jgi:hypothetical protein
LNLALVQQWMIFSNSGILLETASVPACLFILASRATGHFYFAEIEHYYFALKFKFNA